MPRTPAAEVRLSPTSGGGFGQWELHNGTAEPIHPVSVVGFDFGVHLERRGPSGWEPAPIGRCATVESSSRPLPPGQSVLANTLPAIGREVLPAGAYRAVVPYLTDAAVARLRAARGAGSGASVESRTASVEFEVVGLTAAESAAFLDAISTPEARSCLDRVTLSNYMLKFSWVGHRPLVPRLLDVPVTTYEEHLILADAITFLPEAAAILLREQEERSGDRALAAGVALFTSRNACSSDAPCREVARRWTRQIEADATPPRAEILYALAERPWLWPPDLAGILLARFERAQPREAVAALASALEAMPDEALPTVGRGAVTALRRRASGTLDAATRASLRNSAHRIARRAHLEPEPLWGEPGLALFGESESGGSDGPCHRWSLGLSSILRFKDPTEMPVRYGEGRDEAGPPIEPARVPWLAALF
jgi:hypothetical protein